MTTVDEARAAMLDCIDRGAGCTDFLDAFEAAIRAEYEDDDVALGRDIRQYGDWRAAEARADAEAKLAALREAARVAALYLLMDDSEAAQGLRAALAATPAEESADKP